MTEYEPIIVERTGDRDIKAQAVEIGEGEHGTGGNSRWSKDWTRGVKVTIYRTRRGKYIASQARWSLGMGEQDHDEAAVYDTPEALLEWLRGAGDLMPAEKQAWQAAAKVDDAIAAVVDEVVD
jgi:hypothetical protein